MQGNGELACLARWGVGYDLVDTEALTANDILLAIAVDAVRKPVAEAILTLILALAKKLWAKDKLVRTGRWDLKAQTSGLGLSGKTVGSVGMGNIGGEMFRLLGPFRPGAAPCPRSLPGPATGGCAERGTGEPGDHFQGIRFRDYQLSLDGGDAGIYQRSSVRDDEAECLLHQYRTRPDRQPGGFGGPRCKQGPWRVQVWTWSNRSRCPWTIR